MSAAIEAAEHALSLLEEALGQVDDPDGELGAVMARAAAYTRSIRTMVIRSPSTSYSTR